MGSRPMHAFGSSRDGESMRCPADGRDYLGAEARQALENGLVDAVDALKLQYPVRGSLLHSSDSIPGCGMTSLVGSSPSSFLLSGSVSAKELESVRRIDCFGGYPVPGREMKESGSGDGNALDPIDGKKDS